MLGDSVTLTGPDSPEGVTYKYLWTIDDLSGNTDVLGSTKSETFEIPSDAATAKNNYVATLAVSAETASSGQLSGCVLTSCVLIKVNKPDTCALTGPTSVCQTETGSIYKYAGSLDAITNKKVAYLKWKVDDATLEGKDKDYTGQCPVDWTKHWGSHDTAKGAQTHKVTAELHSAKQDNLLSSCSMDVTVLPLPDTTITPT